MNTGRHIFAKQDSLVWGIPAGQVLTEYVGAQGLKRAFIVTNRSLADSDLIANLAKSLGAAYAGAYAACAAHSPRSSVLAGARAARDAGADLVVAVGGGSVIDAAKLMLPCLWLGLETDAQIDDLKAGRYDESLRRTPSVRMAAVPTTLSAAEFTYLAGITDTRRGTKELFEHPYYVPSIVVLDPAATLHTPFWLLASTGVRSIDHCVETLCSARPSPYADAMAIGGLKLLSRSLRALKDAPDDLGHRLDCQLGTWLAISGPVAGVPIGASHVIGRVLGGAFSVPHGHTSCVLLAGVLDWNAATDDGRQAQVAAAMGAAPGVAASQAVRELVTHLEQPTTLRALGIGKDAYPVIAERALVMFKHPGSAGNPRPIGSPDDVYAILDRVL